MPGFEPGTYGLRRDNNNLRQYASSRIDANDRFAAGESARTLADSRGGVAGVVGDFPDAILGALLRAQVTWMATGDAAALRRDVIAILARLG